jgi:hypothetical protein
MTEQISEASAIGLREYFNSHGWNVASLEGSDGMVLISIERNGQAGQRSFRINATLLEEMGKWLNEYE